MRPTLPALVDRSTADLSGRIGAFPFRSLERVVAVTVVGALHSEYDAVEVMSREAIPDSSTGADLRGEAVDWGVTPTPDARAAGDLDVTAVTAGTIPAGQRFLIGSLAYRATSPVTWPSPGTLAVPVRAEAFGPDSNAAAGTPAQMGAPHLGDPPTMSGVVVAAGGLTGGARELQEDLRGSLLTRARGPGDIGRLDDYVRWAFEAPTLHGPVWRAWARANPTVPGQTIVWVVQSDMGATSPWLAADVQAYIGTKVPVGATALVMVPTFHMVLVTILTGAVPISGQLEVDVADAVRDLFTTIAEPGDGVSLGALRRGQVENAGRSVGAPNGAVIYPATDVVPAWGEINLPLAIVVS